MSTVKKLPTPDALTVERFDAFISAVTGAGYSADKFTSYRFSAGADLDTQTLETLYANHDIAAAIVDRIVRDALRSGYELDWQGATDQQRRDVVDWAESTYGLTNEVEEARIYSRLFGGGGVVMGINGNIESPAIMGQPVDFLRATPSSRLEGWYFYSNPADQKYGEVETYRFKQLQLTRETPVEPYVMMHESRVVPFYGIHITDEQTIRDKGWGKSVLHRVYDLLLKFDSSFDSVLATLAESSIPVYKVKSLLDLLASENGELLAKRFELINAAKGAYRAVILDMEETFERVEASLQQASNVVDAAMIRVAGASGQPATILWGMQPAGQNSTGQSDLENWNQQVASEQRLVIGPAIRRVYRYLLAQPDSPIGKSPDDLKVSFPAVETPSIQDQVNFYAQIAGADAVYEQMGAATAAEIAIKRSQQTGTLFPSVDLSYLSELDEIKKETLLNPPDPMEMAQAAPEEEPAPEDDRSEDSLIFTRDGKTYIKSGDAEYLVGGDDE